MQITVADHENLERKFTADQTRVAGLMKFVFKNSK
jgi:hypothetical protein